MEGLLDQASQALASVDAAPAPLPPGMKYKSGLTISFDSTWMDGPGYRPIKIHITPQPGMKNGKAAMPSQSASRRVCAAAQ